MKNWDGESSKVPTVIAATASPVFPFSFWRRQEPQAPSKSPPSVLLLDADAVDAGSLDTDTVCSAVAESAATKKQDKSDSPASGVFQLELPVSLDTLCLVTTSMPGHKGGLELRLSAGCHWIQLDFREPVLLTRIAIRWGAASATIGKYEFQIPDPMYERWETWMVMPSPICRIDDFRGKEHDVDLPLTEPLQAFRVAVRDVPSAVSVGTIRVDGYRSRVAGVPIALATASLLNAETIRVTVSTATAPIHGMANLKSILWILPVHSTMGGSQWIKFKMASAGIITRVVLDWGYESPEVYELQIPARRNSWRTVRNFPDEGNIGVESLGGAKLEDGFFHASRSIHTIDVPIAYQPTSSLRLLVHPNNRGPRVITLRNVRLHGYVMDSPALEGIE